MRDVNQLTFSFSVLPNGCSGANILNTSASIQATSSLTSLLSWSRNSSLAMWSARPAQIKSQSQSQIHYSVPCQVRKSRHEKINLRLIEIIIWRELEEYWSIFAIGTTLRVGVNENRLKSQKNEHDMRKQYFSCDNTGICHETWKRGNEPVYFRCSSSCPISWITFASCYNKTQRWFIIT